MKQLLIAVSVSSALMLAACGGGGGGGESNKPSTSSTPTVGTSTGKTSSNSSSTNNSSAGNASANSSSTNNSSAGNASANSDSAGSSSAGSTSAINSSTNSTPATDSESATIITAPDGTKINLDLSPKGAVTSKTNDGTLKGWNQDASFYGAWLNNSKQLQEISYYGTLTPEKNIPNSGSATYYGNAVRNDSINEAILLNAKSRIQVDFGRKTVSGEIQMPGLRRDITLHEGRLNGASYSGAASVFGNSGGRYEGGLFGKHYEETAGVVKFDNNSSLNTSFGGKRY